jgi:hypothetical protein
MNEIYKKSGLPELTLAPICIFILRWRRFAIGAKTKHGLQPSNRNPKSFNTPFYASSPKANPR